MKVKRYVGSVPVNVSKAMGRFAGGILASVDRVASDHAMQKGSCHPNVEAWVADNGGKAVTGWMLEKISQLTSAGIWVWTFHTVWMDKKGNLLDITDHGNFHDAEKTVFWIDVFRKPDLVEGFSYNNILAIDNSAFAQHYGESIGIEIKAGDIYWSTPDMLYLKPQNKHTGRYRLLGDKYAANEKLFEAASGAKVAGGKLVGTDLISKELMLDYSLK
jgi:hypothetical protein